MKRLIATRREQHAEGACLRRVPQRGRQAKLDAATRLRRRFGGKELEYGG